MPVWSGTETDHYRRPVHTVNVRSATIMKVDPSDPDGAAATRGVAPALEGRSGMHDPRATRRTVLQTLGGAVAVGVGAGAVSAGGPDELSHQLNTVRAETREYRDIETARDDGYAAISPYVPEMGFHFADGPPFGTDSEDPGVLVYYTNGSYNPDPGEEHDPVNDGDLILGAVEWLVPGNQEDDPANIFADEESPRNLKVTEEEGWHFESEEGFTGLHAWVHRGNPAGVFHPTNPNID